MEMYRFLLRPKWIAFHLVVVAAIVAMVMAGFWQLRRLDERQAFNRTVIERSEQTPRPVEELLDGTYDADADEWLPVVLTGSYLPEQIIEFNQSQGGRAGENVLAALLLDDGSTVIVNRGFIILGAEVPPAPAVEVTVRGLVRASEQRDRGGLTDQLDPELREVRRVDIPQIATLLPGEVAPFYVQLVDRDPPITATDPDPATRPDLDSGPHLSYAVQWFVFSLCVAVGWVLAVRRSLRSRRRAGVDATGPGERSDELSDDDPRPVTAAATAAATPPRRTLSDSH